MGIRHLKVGNEPGIDPGEIRQYIEENLGGLDHLGKSIGETQRFFTWWRFLGYGPGAEKFLENLDMRDPDNGSVDRS